MRDIGAATSAGDSRDAGYNQRKLRIGIVARSLVVPAWQWRMLAKLAQASHLELSVLVVLKNQAGGHGCETAPPGSALPVSSGLARLLERLYGFLDSRFTCEPDACATKDAQALLQGVLRIDAAGADDPSPVALADAIAERIRHLDLDVLIALDDSAAPTNLASCARYGVWALYFGERRRSFGRPPGFWEVYFNSRVTESGVEMTTQRGVKPQVICRSFSGIEQISVRLTMNNVYWKSLSLMPRKLEELYRTGPQKFFGRIAEDAYPVFDDAPGYGVPGSAHMASHIVRTLIRRISNMTERIVSTRPWLLLFNFGDTMSTSMRSFEKIVPPRDRYWADPLVMERDGRHYVFFEEYMNATSKGHISVLAADGPGQYGAPVTVLDRKYHLSYPFIFEHDGSIYMVPESYDNRTVELYRCTHFPTKWEFVENLLEDIYAVDSTLFLDKGKWWLFANVVEDRGASAWEELFVYSSDRLVGGTWNPHPLNPVVSDVRCSRPAGAIFVENGRLYRPAQDCSVRYGYGIRIRHITRLSEDDYAEVEVAAIEPHWDKRIVATHTLNHAGGMTVMDALQPRIRL